jgi:5'(3')-deoxyribonucleotidase
MMFIDMDGVLADFDTVFGLDFNKDKFNDFIHSGGFKNLPLMPNANKLIEELIFLENNFGVYVEILSSLGNTIYPYEAATDKSEWLLGHGIQWKANFVLHKGLKKRFATPKSILIDDTLQNIYDWEENHGKAVLWRDDNLELSFKRLYSHLNDINNKADEYFHIYTP